MTNQHVKAATKTIVELLVLGDYEQVERLTQGRRMDRQAIQGAIRDYGRTLVPVPDHSYDSIDVVPIKSVRSAWSVRLHLWTAEEGESDLSVELTILEGDGLTIELDDIHAL